ncbi:thioredoxin domain-containing protein [Hyphomonas sp.]|uniref:TlpA family protein disulfide reductase n=1 Tax=Hyphomonas sp. TaxID=87 RepID=UPI0032F02FF5|tara:strand:+ start:74 stop:577 length:504 start_codon:yes stop_codon:yes gene_type:complete
MAFKPLSTLLALAILGIGAAAEPAVKVVNFSASWCPPCRVLDPRVQDAVERFRDQGVALVELDMTDLDRSSTEGRKALAARLQAVAASHGAAYLWDWYGGHAGIVVIIAADNGEPLTCVTRVLSRREIEDRLQESLVLARKVRPGHRRPNGTDCPAPMNAGVRSQAN